MLDSMVNNPRPTRAEVSDVANAILDGTDAVMLSNETAVGKYPVEAVATMAKVAECIEQDRDELIAKNNSNTDRSIPKASIPNAISAAVGQVASQLNAAAIMTLTKTGATARNVSKFRPTKPILAITPHVDVSRRLQLVWGVKPLLVLDLASTSATFEAAINVALEKNLLADGDLHKVSGSTNLMKVEVVKAVLGQGVGIGQGAASGKARVANHAREIPNFDRGDILVVPSTNAEFVELIRKAAGIITEEDSLTSHAAVIGLRLGIPVIVGFKDATRAIREGSILTLDAQKGLVYSGVEGRKII